ncbi:MAG: PEP-CTERM sorting domain-containing protein, partial [Armatimonadetes bacterium]|nr:PEP-CTERM sorting domain-containing protein [Armatimonadota bacterium]
DLNGVYEMPDEAYVWQPDPSNPNYQFSYYLRLRGTKTAIPEPGTLALLGLGVLPLIRRRK